MKGIKKYILCLVVLTSCKVDFSLCKYFNCYTSNITKLAFEKNSWRYNDPLNFEFSIQDTYTSYDIFLVVKYDYTYPFYNLHINYNIYTGENQVIENGTRDINLFDSSTGKALGFILWPNTVTLKFLILKDYKFSKLGKYCFLLQHAMRKSDLMGLKSIELKLVTKKK